MLYIISYDIENDKTRSKISKVLEGFGQRVQKSVFECQLDEKAFKQLLEQLSKNFSSDGEDSIRIYQICQTCKEKSLGIGKIEKPLEEKEYIFL